MIQAFHIDITGVRTQLPCSGSMMLDRNRLRLSDTVEAVHERHAIIWVGKIYIVMRVESPSTIHFERGSERSTKHGPFEHLTLVDGMLLPTLDAESPLVRFEFGTKAWLEPSTMIVWDRVVI